MYSCTHTHTHTHTEQDFDDVYGRSLEEEVAVSPATAGKSL